MEKIHQYFHLLNLDSILETTDFLVAPASTKYHGCEVGGLAKHSLAVAETLMNFTDDLFLTWQDKRSPMLIGLLHDLCKTNTYEQYFDEDGKLRWRYKSSYEDRGHGTLSVKLIEEYGIKLTEEERVCIKYHMGPWTKDIDESIGDKTYSQMLKEYPNLLWVHTADMYVSQILEI
jgi:putative nucleotidyltransferase with HDIG domain